MLKQHLLVEMASFSNSFQQFISTIHFNNSFQQFISTIQFSNSFQQFISAIHSHWFNDDILLDNILSLAFTTWIFRLKFTLINYSFPNDFRTMPETSPALRVSWAELLTNKGARLSSCPSPTTTSRTGRRSPWATRSRSWLPTTWGACFCCRIFAALRYAFMMIVIVAIVVVFVIINVAITIL